MTTPLATLAALDTRVEAILRADGPCKLGEVAKHPSVSGFKYEQVMYSLKRLHAAGRVHYSGLAKARMYMLAPGSERMTTVASEPKLGDRVWFRGANRIERGTLIAKGQRLERTDKGFGPLVNIFEVETERGTCQTSSITLDGCKLIREIESEESK